MKRWLFGTRCNIFQTEHDDRFSVCDVVSPDSTHTLEEWEPTT